MLDFVPRTDKKERNKIVRGTDGQQIDRNGNCNKKYIQVDTLY